MTELRVPPGDQFPGREHPTSAHRDQLDPHPTPTESVANSSFLPKCAGPEIDDQGALIIDGLRPLS